MIKSFHYFAPKTLGEASELLHKYDGTAKVLAGGQSLIPLMKLNLIDVEHVVDLKRIPNLSFINYNGEAAGSSCKGSGSIVVGALNTHTDVGSSSLVRGKCPLLAETANGIGHTQIRNRGTIGGSLSHSDPAADLIPSMLVLGAEMVIRSYDGSRRAVPAEEFFRGPFSTALQADDILEHVQVPVSEDNSGIGYSYQRFTLGYGAFPMLVVSALANVKGRVCEELALAVGGVAERAFRVRKAEEKLIGLELDEEDAILEASRIASETSRPENDPYVSADYKKRMVGVFVRRALTEALRRTTSHER